MDSLVKTDLVTGVRRLFYFVTPNETYAQHVSDIPNYFQESIVFFAVAIGLEMLVAALQGRKHITRLSDGITSITAGMFLLLTSVLIKGFDVVVYTWFHRQFPSLNLSWDSPQAWFICFAGVDLGYYWFHRMAHEVNFMWAAHQVHHSSEDYNLTTALRQSITQRFTSWLFYVPLSPFIPPSTILVHAQFNTLYQFWIHTELIDSIGPLEYILNTPSHHRVHHGRNRYCIDKNYGGTLIIFDRIFGTFEAEKKTDQVVYGLVHPLNSYNPLYIQYCHYQWMWHVFWHVEGLGNKLAVIWKGPGWEPGKPRMGLIEDIPDIHYPQPRYDPQLPLWGSVYIVAHTLLNFLVYAFYTERVGGLSQWSALVGMVYLVFSFTCVGAICDIKWYAPLMESMRCMAVLGALSVYLGPLAAFTGFDAVVFTGVMFLYSVSVLVWVPQCLQLVTHGKRKEL